MSPIENAMLILQRGGNEAGRRWTLGRRRFIIGRNADCDIVLPDRLVSRHHAQVVWQNEESSYIVEDLKSKNGTFVNGLELAGTHALEDGDEIQIALRFKLAFVDTGETAPLTFEIPVTQGRLQIDDNTRQVSLDDTIIDPPLSPAQFRLLSSLIRAQGGVVSRDEVVRQVWPEAVEEGVSEQAIDALIRRLRERLSEGDPEHQYVVTVRGHGFRFENATDGDDDS
ncbi:MAG: FHA domain-containing protein [Chloroflexota bacterium]|nr:FHA domain-containing protein [Chloroflexota bacterium]